jgi:hypothetical protein
VVVGKEKEQKEQKEQEAIIVRGLEEPTTRGGSNMSGGLNSW